MTVPVATPPQPQWQPTVADAETSHSYIYAEMPALLLLLGLERWYPIPSFIRNADIMASMRLCSKIDGNIFCCTGEVYKVLYESCVVEPAFAKFDVFASNANYKKFVSKSQ